MTLFGIFPLWWDTTEYPIGSILPDDPFVDFQILRDKGVTISDTAGTFTGSIPSKTTDVGGGVAGSFNLSQQFDLAANQTLSFNGQFRYDSLKTTLGASALFPGVGSPGSGTGNFYTFGGQFVYRAGNTFFGVGGGGVWGSLSTINSVTAATANFGTHEYFVQMLGGQLFTLFDSVVTAPRSSLPTVDKAPEPPPKPIDGYAIHLLLIGHVDYDKLEANSFTDSTGFMSLGSQVSAWSAAADVTLYARIIDGSLTWRPFVTAQVEAQFDYSGWSDVVAPGLSPDTILFGAPQTFWGGRLGVDVLHASGWDVGIQGIYQQSAEITDVGGQLFVRYFVQPPHP